MRRWWLALAFVPAVAWGDDVCTSPDAERSYRVLAESLRGQYEDGITREEAEFALEMMGTDRVTKKVLEAGVTYTHDARDAFTHDDAAHAMREACRSTARRH